MLLLCDPPQPQTMLDTPPKSAPQVELPRPSSESFYQLAELEKKPSLSSRLLIGGACVAIGLTALAIGASSIIYRLTHLSVDSGLVNGRQIRLQAPINGEVKDFFARPGIAVRHGEVLVRLAPGTEQAQTVLQLEGEVATKTAQLTAAQQSLDLVRRQLQGLDGQDQTLQTVNVQIATNNVSKNRAGLDAAIAAETAARLKYERHRKLLSDGAVSRQLVDQLKAEWQTAQAAVAQEEADLNSRQTSLSALSDGVPLDASMSLQEQRLSLTRTLETQANLVNTLTTQLVTSQNRLKQAKSLLSDRRDVTITAPFAGVVYTTERDTGEQVSRPDVLLTLLDCNDLWVETLVSAEQANRIMADKPVRVQLVGETETFIGQVELIEAINRAELAKDQAKTLLPSLPAQLEGLPISRVRVRIPPSTQQNSAQKLCGVGQAARLTFNLKLFGG